MNTVATHPNLPGTSAKPRGPELPEARAASPRRLAARAAIQFMARRLPISIELPDNSVIGAGKLDAPVVKVKNARNFFSRIGGGTAGFAESYIAGDWDCADLPGLFAVLAAHLPELMSAPVRALRRVYIPRTPADEDDTVEGARLSNDFFRLFLDSSMTYSSGLFEPGDILEQAQIRKIDRLLDLTGTGPGTRLLEIGTGWGALALRAAARGAVVTTVTNSEAQWRRAGRRIADAGVTDRVDARLSDYRQITGDYDAVISVEMIEAVGIRYLPEYFRVIDRVLAPGGTAGIQSITMPHDQMLVTMNSQSWIHKYIFPGGQIPSRQAIAEAAAGTGLRLDSEFSMGRHYATTLGHWRDRLAYSQEDVLALGFSAAFLRMWDLYLAYSQGGFLAGYLDVWQLGLTRSGIR
jgi:cyclopropane-fatty-acyl-phospholipid synthase